LTKASMRRMTWHAANAAVLPSATEVGETAAAKSTAAMQRTARAPPRTRPHPNDADDDDWDPLTPTKSPSTRRAAPIIDDNSSDDDVDTASITFTAADAAAHDPPGTVKRPTAPQRYLRAAAPHTPKVLFEDSDDLAENPAGNAEHTDAGSGSCTVSLRENLRRVINLLSDDEDEVVVKPVQEGFLRRSTRVVKSVVTPDGASVLEIDSDHDEVDETPPSANTRRGRGKASVEAESQIVTDEIVTDETNWDVTAFLDYDENRNGRGPHLLVCWAPTGGRTWSPTWEPAEMVNDGPLLKSFMREYRRARAPKDGKGTARRKPASSNGSRQRKPKASAGSGKERKKPAKGGGKRKAKKRQASRVTRDVPIARMALRTTGRGKAKAKAEKPPVYEVDQVLGYDADWHDKGPHYRVRWTPINGRTWAPQWIPENDVDFGPEVERFWSEDPKVESRQGGVKVEPRKLRRSGRFAVGAAGPAASVDTAAAAAAPPAAAGDVDAVLLKQEAPLQWTVDGEDAEEEWPIDEVIEFHDDYRGMGPHYCIRWSPKDGKDWPVEWIPETAISHGPELDLFWSNFRATHEPKAPRKKSSFARLADSEETALLTTPKSYTLQCSECRKHVHVDSYSAKQRRESSQTRRCLSCTTSDGSGRGNGWDSRGVLRGHETLGRARYDDVVGVGEATEVRSSQKRRRLNYSEQDEQDEEDPANVDVNGDDDLLGGVIVPDSKIDTPGSEASSAEPLIAQPLKEVGPGVRLSIRKEKSPKEDLRCHGKTNSGSRCRVFASYSYDAARTLREDGMFCKYYQSQRQKYGL